MRLVLATEVVQPMRALGSCGAFCQMTTPGGGRGTPTGQSDSINATTDTGATFAFKQLNKALIVEKKQDTAACKGTAFASSTYEE
eukprot:3086299-Amphidinium_carterae.1